MDLSADSFTREWKQYGVTAYLDMTPNKCGEDSAAFCKLGLVADTIAEELRHAQHCGYSECLDEKHHERKECCSKAQLEFDITFKKGTKCEAAINYNACDSSRPGVLDNDESLACAKTTADCQKTQDCFPECCDGLKFDFSTTESIKASESSDCFKYAPHLIEPLNDKDDLIGQYIYHHSIDCKKIGDIINPKCCNEDVDYKKGDPCFCYGSTSSSCNTVSFDECNPNSSNYPECCFDIGSKLFGNNDFCTCRLNDDPKSETKQTCNDGIEAGKEFQLLEPCPNPCKDGKALLTDNSLICELPAGSA
jgi:hypothetical protein